MTHLVADERERIQVCYFETSNQPQRCSSLLEGSWREAQEEEQSQMLLEGS